MALHVCRTTRLIGYPVSARAWLLWTSLLVASLLARSASCQTVPDHIGQDDIAALKGRVMRLAPPTNALVYEPSASVSVKDPRSGATFAFSAAVYANQTGEFFHRFTIHAPNDAWRPLAERVARFVAVLWSAADSRFGTLCAALREHPCDVWLSTTGTAGGEHWHTNIYFYDIGNTRSGIEWMREIAHEYGHFLLPGTCGYSAPEDWANGVLGERLFLRWLLQDTEAGRLPANELPFGTRADLQMYCDRQVVPLMEAADRRAPASDVLARTDRAGFDGFTALMLQMDRIYGARALLDILEYLPDPMSPTHHGPDFLHAMEGWIESLSTLTTTLHKGAQEVYLPRGIWHVKARDNSAEWSLEDVRRKRDDDGWSVRLLKPGWKMVRCSGSDETVLTWQKR